MTINKTKRLVIDAMLAAMCFVLSRYASITLPTVKISFDSLPVLVAALLLGPLDGMAVGLIGRFFEQLFSQYGLTVTTPLWILPHALRGLLVGLYARRHAYQLEKKQLYFITTAAALLVTALNTLVQYIDSRVFSYSYVAALPTLLLRIVLGILTAVLFAGILPGILAPLRKMLGAKSTLTELEE
ncbi:MAG: folate family ECF transporter S component [Oscillospiraceae bacterium]|nr:folate family ECF transporter S component [Oscillospiraceae bacterium]